MPKLESSLLLRILVPTSSEMRKRSPVPENMLKRSEISSEVPSYSKAMLDVSKRIRKHSEPPSPLYCPLGISQRPGIISAAMGKDPPSKIVLRNRLLGTAQRKIS